MGPDISMWKGTAARHKEREGGRICINLGFETCCPNRNSEYAEHCVKKVVNKITKHSQILPRLKVYSKHKQKQSRKDITVTATISDFQETFNSP